MYEWIEINGALTLYFGEICEVRFGEEQSFVFSSLVTKSIIQRHQITCSRRLARKLKQRRRRRQRGRQKKQ